MKHQYFGDVNDYRKYGLLRALARETGLTVGICWMLTADDNRRDGQAIGYLSMPDLWRAFDADLFDFLKEAVPQARSLTHVRKSFILKNAVTYEAELEDSRSGRAQYFEGSMKALANSQLVFFDPDNGLEVKSVPMGRKGSCKYLYWTEFEAAFASGRSVLAYQHYPHEERRSFAERIVNEIGRRVRVTRVIEFGTSKVAFILAPQPHHVQAFENAVTAVVRDWGSQFNVRLHSL